MSFTYELSAEIGISFGWNHYKIDGDSDRSARDSNALALVMRFTDGTGKGQFDKLFHDRRTVAAASNDDLDLTSGVLEDIFGGQFIVARIRAFAIQLLSTDPDATAEVGGAAANPWAGWLKGSDDAVLIEPEGIVLFVAPSAAGYPVTADSSDILRIRAPDAVQGIQYDIAMLGSSI